jgi:hemerythrin superfamily protein
VSLAIALSRLVERLRDSELSWKLSEDEKKALTLSLYRRIVARHDLLEEKFWETRNR